MWGLLSTASLDFLVRLSLFLTAQLPHSVLVPDWCLPAGAVGVGFKEIPPTTVNSSVGSPLRYTALIF